MSELPKGWTKTKLSEVASLIMGQSPPSDTYNTSGHGLPFFQGKAEFGNIYPTAVKYCSVPQKIAKAEDILISVRAPVGPTNICREESCIGRGLAAVRPLDQIPSRYLFYYLRSIEEWLAMQGTGSTFTAISKSDLEQIDIALAPLNEQCRIVAKLEKLLSKVEASRERLDKIPRILKRFRQSVLAAACSGRLTADWREEVSSAIDESGLPLSWESRSIGELEIFIGSGITPKGGKAVYVSEGVPFIRSQNVYPSGLVLDDVAYITREMHRAMARTHLKPNDILLNITGASIGRSTVVPEDFREGNVNQHVCIIRLDEAAMPQFVSMFLNSPAGQGLIFETQVGVTREGLNYGQLREFVIPLPPLEEQQEIVRRVEELFKFADQIEERYRKARAHLDRLAQSILAKAVRGELVSQDPNDEPASQLLERIRQERALVEPNSKPTRKERKKRDTQTEEMFA